MNQQLPDLLPESPLISTLTSRHSEHLDFLREAVPTVFDNLKAEDHLVIAALRRSLDNKRQRYHHSSSRGSGEPLDFPDGWTHLCRASDADQGPGVWWHRVCLRDGNVLCSAPGSDGADLHRMRWRWRTTCRCRTPRRHPAPLPRPRDGSIAASSTSRTPTVSSTSTCCFGFRSITSSVSARTSTRKRRDRRRPKAPESSRTTLETRRPVGFRQRAP